MTVEIRPDDLTGAATRRLVARHLAGVRALSPAESVHALDIDALRDAAVTFWSAWVDGEIAGIGALKMLDPRRGEIKSMRVDDRFLGAGVGRGLLRHIIAEARARGIRSLWLETGTEAAFLPAQRLYASEGFVPCGPFDGYRADPHSLFMTLTLPAPAVGDDGDGPPASTAVAAAADADRLTAQLQVLLGPAARLGRSLPGGAHARTHLVTYRDEDLVARWFPPGDPAASRERAVLAVLAGGPAGAAIPLAVPRLVAHGEDLLVTTRVPGHIPPPDADPRDLALPLARTLAVVHAHDPGPLEPRDPVGPHAREGYAAGRRESGLQPPDPAILAAPDVLSHGDFWCGNALWSAAPEIALTGLVDWSGAHRAPRGADLAWCRQDLALLGSPAAAELFAAEYCRLTGFEPAHVHAWDVHATWRAWRRVGYWADNYAGIGRPGLTSAALEANFADWVAHLRSQEA